MTLSRAITCKIKLSMEAKAIHLEGATITQTDGSLVLKNVNLTVQSGEFVYLVGKTGTGKSSLLRTLYGELALKSGQGLVAKVDLRDLTRKEIPLLRRKIGIVFQDFQLLDDRSVSDNLLFVLQATDWTDEDSMQMRIKEVLALVDMEWSAPKMPHELSGGEQQRIVLARALLNQPTLIIADEPTGNLDPDTSDDIMKLIHDVSEDQGAAVIMATHDYRLINKFPGTVYRTMDQTLLPEGIF